MEKRPLPGSPPHLVSPEQPVPDSAFELVPDVQELRDPVLPDMVGVLFSLRPLQRRPQREQPHPAAVLQLLLLDGLRSCLLKLLCANVQKESKSCDKIACNREMPSITEKALGNHAEILSCITSAVLYSTSYAMRI